MYTNQQYRDLLQRERDESQRKINDLQREIKDLKTKLSMRTDDLWNDLDRELKEIVDPYAKEISFANVPWSIIQTIRNPIVTLAYERDSLQRKLQKTRTLYNETKAHMDDLYPMYQKLLLAYEELKSEYDTLTH